MTRVVLEIGDKFKTCSSHACPLNLQIVTAAATTDVWPYFYQAIPLSIPRRLRSWFSVLAQETMWLFAANLVAKLNHRFSKQAGYAGLFLSMALAYALPLRWFFLESLGLKIVASMLLLCAPVFFAGIVFVRTFAEAGFKGEALGSNLLGAAAGGFLESLSYWTGLKALLIVAAILYLVSLVAAKSKVRDTAPVLTKS